MELANSSRRAQNPWHVRFPHVGLVTSHPALPAVVHCRSEMLALVCQGVMRSNLLIRATERREKCFCSWQTKYSQPAESKVSKSDY